MKRSSIKAGDRLPEFELPDQDGRTVRSADIIGKGPVVIYFYPHDDTPGCTKEACAFRDAYEDFKDAGATVIGISSDTSGSHKKFAKKHRLPFTLLTDPDGKVKRAFGVSDYLGILPGRVTFVVDRTGIIRLVFNSPSRIEQHIGRSLDMIKNLMEGS
jgi:peroxiredoxin Q/BCP